MKGFLSAMDLIGATPRTLLDKLRVGIAVADAKDGRILFANCEFSRIVGCPTDRLTEGQTSYLEFTHPDDRQRNEELQAALLSGKSDQYALEKRYLRTDGSIVWARVTVDVIQRAEQTTWTVALVEDISARRILEQQLSAVENVAEIATWNWSVKKNVSTISPSYNALHGLPSLTPPPTFEDALSQVHPDDRNEFSATIGRGIENREGFTHEYRVILESGQIKWLRITATCLYDAEGRVSNLIGATIDITNVKTRELPAFVSRPIRDVLRHMDENLSMQVSVAALGKIYGISARTIHKYFSSQGTTPNRYLKSLRLRKARLLLQASDRGTTVTAVALKCGFANMGHFAKDYRQEFGEAPSDTIKQAR